MVGLQEVSVKGQDCVYKDVIEPLESVSINIIETNKTDIKEFGNPEEVWLYHNNTYTRICIQYCKYVHRYIHVLYVFMYTPI